MPKIAPIRIKEEAEDGTEYDQRCEVTVTANGKFRVTAPPELQEVAWRFIHKEWTKWPGIELGKQRDREYVEGRELAKVEAFLEACAKDYLTVEKVTERVIAFTFDPCVCFWSEPPHHLIVGNGYCSEDRHPEGQWWKSKFTKQDKFTVCGNRELPPMFAVGFGAAVFDKVTWKRASGDKTTWERVRQKDHLSMPSNPAELLNSYKSFNRDPSHGCSTIPYSDEAAAFFTKMVVGLCQMAAKLDHFLTDKEALTAAIESGKALQLMS